METSGIKPNEAQKSESEFNRRHSFSSDLVSLSSSSSVEDDSHFNESSNIFTETINSTESEVTAPISTATANTDAKSYGKIISDNSIEVLEKESDDLRNASSVHTPSSSSSHWNTSSSGGRTGDSGGNVSGFSYQLLDKDKLTIPDYECAGLLYARSSKEKYNR